MKVVLKVCEFCHIPVLVELLSAKNELNLLISKPGGLDVETNRDRDRERP